MRLHIHSAGIVILFFSLSIFAEVAEPIPSLLAKGRVDEAISTLRSRISVSPNDAEAHNLLCRAYFSLGDWNRGVEDCEKATSLEPSNSRYHMWLGRIYGEKADRANFMTAAGLAKKVRTEFEAAVQLNPKSVDARTDLAEFYLEAPGIVGGGRDKAEAQASALSTLDPAKAHWVSARIAEKKKDSAAAEQEYRAAIKSSQGAASAWLNLALYYKHTNKLNEMTDAIGNVSSAHLDRADALVDAAEILIHTDRNLPQAAQLLKRYIASTTTVEQAPPFKAHYLLGTVLQKQGDKQAAEREFRAALALAKNFSPAQQALDRINQ